MEIKLVLSGLDCANCAAKMENAIKKIDGVNSVSYNTVFQYNQMQLPDELFMMNTDDRDNDMVDLFSEDEQANKPYSVLQGNLSKYW